MFQGETGSMPTNLSAKFGRALRSVVRSLREFAYADSLPGRYPPSIYTRPRIGLALSGGFAHGLAHIGVLKALKEHRIPIDALAGTSVGSLVAGAFASGCSVAEMIEEARKIRWRSFARLTLARLGVATNDRMQEMLRRVLHCSTFEELAIPLAVVAVDLYTGESVVFRRGEMIPPLRASCCFPGLFTPVEYQGRLLIDGAICCSVPVTPLLDFGVDVIVAVNLRTNGLRLAPSNMFQVIGQALQIAEGQNQGGWREHCDIVIEPEVDDFKWDDFGRAHDLILAGERAALKALPALRALLQSKPAGQVQAPTPLGRATLP